MYSLRVLLLLCTAVFLVGTNASAAQSGEPLCDVSSASPDQTPIQGSDPLAGRLGGTRASFEERFGPPAKEEPNITYELPGCEYMTVDFDADYGESVLTRFYFNSLGASLVGVWSFEEAQAIAARLLPLDVVQGQPFRNVSFVEHQPCQSVALAERVPAALYTDYDLNATPGQCSVAYEFDEAGDVIGFTVQLAIEDLS